MQPFKVAVITPFHAEPAAVIETARRSVRAQTWPHLLHVMVGDESQVQVEPDARTLVVRLPKGCRDFGDTPRALGALYAAGLGVDAVAFLDADNWYYPTHIEQLVKLHAQTGAHVLTSRRAFHRMDGTYMAECTASDGKQFADTNCLFLTRPAFPLLTRWILMDPKWHGIDDRVFWDHIRQQQVSLAHHAQATVAYRAQFAGAYTDLEEVPPAEARRGDQVRQALQSWLEATGRSLKVQWGYSRRQRPDEVLDIHALTISEQGAVNLTRVGRPLLALADAGAARVRIGTSLTFDPAARAGILILHRHFLSDPAMRQVLDRLAQRGWLLISDIDDDPHHWPGYVDSRMVAFKGVHAVTVSTSPLVDMLGAWNPNIALLPNMVDDLPAAVLAKRSRILARTGGEVVDSGSSPLRVFFGAFNRRDDAAPLIEGLSAIPPAAREGFEFHVLHDRAVHDALPVGFRRVFHPTAPWGGYMERLAACDVAVLPLNDTHFNRFKSDLKLIECLAAGAVPICSPVVYGADHVASTCPGGIPASVRYAHAPADWAQQLLALQADAQARVMAQRVGYEHVFRHRLQWQQNGLRLGLYRDWLARQPELEQQRQERMRVWAREDDLPRA